MDGRLRRLDIKTALSAVADLALPRVCIVCGEVLVPQEKHLCTGCMLDLPETHFASFSHNPMADRLNDKIQRDRERAGEAPFEGYSYAAALYFYSTCAAYKKISQALKYHRNFAAGAYFAGLLGDSLAASPLYADVDLVVPVPLHWTRRWKRGYNQAEVIGREVAARLGARLGAAALKRCRRTRSQAKLSADAKAGNVAGAFSADGNICAKHILLIDDVFTTGATLSACHLALRQALGPDVRISVATLAYAGPR